MGVVYTLAVTVRLPPTRNLRHQAGDNANDENKQGAATSRNDDADDQDEGYLPQQQVFAFAVSFHPCATKLKSKYQLGWALVTGEQLLESVSCADLRPLQSCIWTRGMTPVGLTDVPSSPPPPLASGLPRRARCRQFPCD